MTAEEKEVQQNILTFYKTLEKYQNEWNLTVNQIKPFLIALINQCEQLNAVFRFKIDQSEFTAFENLQDFLLGQIYRNIEQEILSIEKLINVLNIKYQELNNKIMKLEKSSLSLDLTGNNIINRGSALQRPLNEILKWAYLIKVNYSKQITIIYEAFKGINYKEIKSIEKLQESIEENVNNRHIVSQSLMYLQFSDKVKISTP